MCDGGFDTNDRQLCGFDALAPPLAEIKGRCLDAGEQNGEASVPHDRAGSHVKLIAAHAGEMTLFIFQLESASAERDDFDFQNDRASVEAAAFATDGKSDRRIDTGSACLGDCGGVCDAYGAVRHVPFEQCPEDARAISRRAAADIVRWLDEHRQAGRW